MSRHQELLDRMRSANPVPHPDRVDPDELGVVLSLIDDKRGVIGPAEEDAEAWRLLEPQRPRWRAAVAFAVSLVLVLVAVGVAGVILRGGETEPAATTVPPPSVVPLPETIPPDTAPPTTSTQPEPAATSISDLIWTRVPHDDVVFGDDTTGLTIWDITYGHGIWLAGGWESAAGSDGELVDVPVFWTSKQGVSWTRVDVDTGEEQPSGLRHVRAVAATDGGFIAVGYHQHAGIDDSVAAAIWTSSNGTSWTQVPYDQELFGGFEYDGFIGEVIAEGNSVIAVGAIGNAAAVWRSDDGGATWTLVPHSDAVFGSRDTSEEMNDGRGDGRQAMASIARGPAGLVAVGKDGGMHAGDGEPESSAAVWISQDGSTWQRVARSEAVFGGNAAQGMAEVVWTGDRFVAVGNELRPPSYEVSRPAVWYSPDGTTWNRVPADGETLGDYTDNSRMQSVATGPNGLVAVGQSGTARQLGAEVWSSRDGMAWARSADSRVFADAYLRGIAGTETGFILVGGGTGSDGTLPSGEAAIWVGAIE